MLVYFTVDFLVALLGVMLVNKSIRVGNNHIHDNAGNNVYFVIVVALLIFISAFRGDFNPDYRGYEDIYNRFSYISFDAIIRRDMFSYPEKGYLLFQYVINHVFQNVIWLFITTSIIIVVSHAYHIKKYAPNLLLAFILFVEVGTYYTSFNLMRNMLAISIVVMGSTYIYEKKPIKFFAFVVVAGFIHTSAFFMIPMYFVLNLKLKKKGVLIYPIILVVLVIALPTIIQFVQRYYWSWYFTSDSQYGRGYTWRSVLIPFVMDAFSIGTYLMEYRKQKSSDSENDNHEEPGPILDNIENVWLNATFLHLTFALMGFRISIISRFTAYFSLYSILFFCAQVEKSKYKKLIIVGVVILATVYCQITRNDYPYYFIWNR